MKGESVGLFVAFLAVCGAENSRIWCLLWGPRRDFKVSNGYRFIIWSLGGEAMIFGYSTLFYGWVFGPTNGSVWVFMDPTWNDFAFRLKVYGCQGSVLVELRVVGPGVPGKRIPGLSILLALSRLFGLSACMEHLVENVCILVALSRLFG